MAKDCIANLNKTLEEFKEPTLKGIKDKSDDAWTRISRCIVDASCYEVGNGKAIFYENEALILHLAFIEKIRDKLAYTTQPIFNQYLANVDCINRMNFVKKWIFQAAQKELLQQLNERIQKDGESEYGSVAKIFEERMVKFVLFCCNTFFFFFFLSSKKID